MNSSLKCIVVLMFCIVVSCSNVGKTGLVTKQAEMEIQDQIQEIMSRAVFSGARWGMEFYVPETNETVFSLNNDQYFSPASSVKIFTAGTAFETLGVDYRFHTPVYRTGSVVNGVLYGDLVIRASGDLLLGGRINNDGTINLPDPDHTYDTAAGAMPVSDDPLHSIRGIVDQIALSGIRHIEGNILVDNSLFREEAGEAGGTGSFIVSPMIINDNLIDVLITPASTVGAPAELRILPATSYLTVVNKTVTVAAAGRQAVPGSFVMMGRNALRFIDDTINEDGTRTVTLIGEIPLDNGHAFRAYRIPEPARFAEIILTELLDERGITIQSNSNAKPDFGTLSRFYTSEYLVAEIISPALDVEVLPMLKVSSNPHTVTWPYLVGSITGGDHDNAREKGMSLQAELFGKVGVNPLAMPSPNNTNVFGQASNANRTFEEEYMPSSFTKFLTYLYSRPYFERFKDALPILGIDGTLSEIHPDSKAAGNVFAKTGTSMQMQMRNGEANISLKKALAGFIELPNGKLIVFSVFLEYSPSSPDITEANQVMGEIVNIIYEALAV